MLPHSFDPETNMASDCIGVNLRISEHSNCGGRTYMEDFHTIQCVRNNDRGDQFVYFGIFDGHGGPEAAKFARDNLLNQITKYDRFWTDSDEDILSAIRSGFLDTHQAMRKELDKWPCSVNGMPSTSGTTASIAIIKKCKLYIGHVGDSGIVLGCREGPDQSAPVKPQCLTKDHKPDDPEEKKRIESSGGFVDVRAGVQRVVWKRPKVGHKGPIRRNTQMVQVPFLAVARSLGDFWSFDCHTEQFAVSPNPDVSVIAIEPDRHQCLILASDGLWNMMTPAKSVEMVNDVEMHFQNRIIHDSTVPLRYWVNPAERLVKQALGKWRTKKMTADNVSCVVVLFDPLGPSKLTVLHKQRLEHLQTLRDLQVMSAVEHEDRSPSAVSGGHPLSVASCTMDSVCKLLSAEDKCRDSGEGDAEPKEERMEMDSGDNENRTQQNVVSCDSCGDNNKACSSHCLSFSSIPTHCSSSETSPVSSSVHMSPSESERDRVQTTLHEIHRDSVCHSRASENLSHQILISIPSSTNNSVDMSPDVAITPPLDSILPPSKDNVFFPGSSSEASVERPAYKPTFSMSFPISSSKLMETEKVGTPLHPSCLRNLQLASEQPDIVSTEARQCGTKEQMPCVQHTPSSCTETSAGVTHTVPATLHMSTHTCHGTCHSTDSFHSLPSPVRAFHTNTSSQEADTTSDGQAIQSVTGSDLCTTSQRDGDKPCDKCWLAHSSHRHSTKRIKRGHDFKTLYKTRARTTRHVHKAAVMKTFRKQHSAPNETCFEKALPV